MNRWLFTCTVILVIILNGCTKNKGYPDEYGYPEEVGHLLLTKCATPGCHTAQSKAAAGGLNLSSWNALFEGSGNGQPVIPYRADYSSLLYFVNTYEDLGVKLPPSMPLGGTPLSREEVTRLKNWVLLGAPNLKGEVAFAGNPLRKKIYVTNQGCDVVTVFDAETGLPMRFIDVGAEPGIEAPHMVKVAPDGNYWYVICIAGKYLQKYRTTDDILVGQAKISTIDNVAYNWNTFGITPDSKIAVCTDLNPNGHVTLVDLETMQVIAPYNGYLSPHGLAFVNDSVVYTCANNSNYVYKLSFKKPYSMNAPDQEKISFTNSAPVPTFLYLPHEVAFSPEGDKYFITCQKSSEVRVMDAATDVLITTIKTGQSPSEMSFSPSTGYLFVTCMDDATSFPGLTGSVAVIDYKTNVLIKHIHTGFNPHGIAIDESKGIVYVANRNVSPNGPAPHHQGACTGRNGYVTTIDIKTLKLVSGKKVELAVDPYSVAIRP